MVCKSKYPYKPWEGLPFLLPRSSHTNLHNYGTKKMRHFARPCRVLKSGILQIRIIAGILSSGIWDFCHIWEILLLNTHTGHVKCHCFPYRCSVELCVINQAYNPEDGGGRVFGRQFRGMRHISTALYFYGASKKSLQKPRTTSGSRLCHISYGFNYYLQLYVYNFYLKLT